MSEATDDFLSHYGVVGMKWGKRSGGKSGSGGSGKNGKLTSADIHSARYRQDLRLRKLQEAEGDFYVARTAKGQDKAEKIMRKHEKTYFTHPDAAVAAKMTKGEKVYTSVILGLAAVTAVGLAADMTRSMTR